MSEQDVFDPCVVFVGNLPYSYLDADLKAIFNGDGAILVAVVVQDERERSRGFGFVRFDDPMNAKLAVEKINYQELDGRKLRLSFARKDSRYLHLVEA
jgi:RNA recognition motif-containing protein